MYGYIAVVLRRQGAGFRVEFPHLPGCRCAAPSVEDALARAERILGIYAAGVHRQGQVLPPARPAHELLAESERLGAVAGACLRAPDPKKIARLRAATSPSPCKITVLDTRDTGVARRASVRL